MEFERESGFFAEEHNDDSTSCAATTEYESIFKFTTNTKMAKSDVASSLQKRAAKIAKNTKFL